MTESTFWSASVLESFNTCPVSGSVKRWLSTGWSMSSCNFCFMSTILSDGLHRMKYVVLLRLTRMYISYHAIAMQSSIPRLNMIGKKSTTEKQWIFIPLIKLLDLIIPDENLRMLQSTDQEVK